MPVNWAVYRGTDGPLRSLDGPIWSIGGPTRSLDGPIRSLDGPTRSIDGPNRSIDSPNRSINGPNRSIDGPNRSIYGPNRSIDGLPLETVNLIDLGVADEPKDVRSRVLAGTKSVLCPVKAEQNGNGQSKEPGQHKVRGSPIPADETSDEDADALPPTGRRRSIGKSSSFQERASQVGG